MASILKGGSAGAGMRWNNLLVICFLLAVVVGLFLIPEFAGWSSRDSQTQSSLDPRSEDELDILERRADEPPVKGALDKLVQMINAGSTLDGGSGNAAEVVAPKQEEGPQQRAQRDLSQLLSRGEALSWKDLHSSAAVQSMRTAQRQVLGLAKRLGTDYPESRFALFNYSGGLSRVMQANEKTMSAAEAVLYIDQLDKAVTEAMLRERVERGDFLIWSEVSLGPLASGSAAASLKKKWAPAFRPVIALSEIRVIQPAGNYGRWNSKGKAYVSGRGYVSGKDVRRLVLWSSDGRERRLGLLRADGLGRRAFRFPRGDARLLYALVASDKSGAEFRKYYEFYNRSRVFVWNRKNGHFMLPFAEYDPRLDMYFRVQSGQDSGGSGNLLQGGKNLAPEEF